MLAFQAEKVEQLKGRLPEALVQAWDPDTMTDKMEDRPGLNRTNIFDFEDGIRLIISKDQIDGKLFLHISGSIHQTCECGLEVKSVSGKWMLEQMVEHIQSLLSLKQDANGEAMASDGGIIHLLFSWEDYLA